MTVQNNPWLSSTTAASNGSQSTRHDSIESPGRFAALLDRAQDAPARGRDSALGNAFEVREAQRAAPQAPREAVRTPEATTAARAQDGAPKQAQNARSTNTERQREPQRPNGERANAERSPQQRGSEGQSEAAQAENAAPAEGETATTASAAASDAPALPGAPVPGSTDLMSWLERLSAQADAAAATEAEAGSPLAAAGAPGKAGDAVGTVQAAATDPAAATEILGGAMLAGTAVPGAASDAAAGAAARIETAPIAGAGATHAPSATHRSHEAAAAPGEAQVPVPMDSPEFPQVLSSQISAFAREGVHEAKLTLNPAEMGPVSVRITVDGKDAQVAFHASQAATRSALEASLPTLAASLSDAGLTLSGGGVFDQAQQQQPQGDRNGGNRSFASSADGGEDIAVTGRAVRHERPRGLLDTYA